MAQKLNELAVGYSVALLSVIVMLLTWIAGNIGWYSGWVSLMTQAHVLFSMSFGGLILGTIEAAFWSFLAGLVFAWFYNRLVR